jgi:hypothetical protein
MQQNKYTTLLTRHTLLATKSEGQREKEGKKKITTKIL